MVTTKKIPIEDTQKKTRKESKSVFTKNQLNTRKAAIEEKRDKIALQHTENNKQNDNIRFSFLSPVTSNIKGLNSPIKRHRVYEWVKKQGLLIYAV